jgi:hypothetical protein
MKLSPVQTPALRFGRQATVQEVNQIQKLVSAQASGENNNVQSQYCFTNEFDFQLGQPVMTEYETMSRFGNEMRADSRTATEAMLREPRETVSVFRLVKIDPLHTRNTRAMCANSVRLCVEGEEKVDGKVVAKGEIVSTPANEPVVLVKETYNVPYWKMLADLSLGSPEN